LGEAPGLFVRTSRQFLQTKKRLIPNPCNNSDWQEILTKTRHIFRKIRTKRLKYFLAAIELIKCGRHEPLSKENPNISGEILHRFYGLTRENKLFCVQIKEIKRTGAG
jgi:hypothetical protein